MLFENAVFCLIFMCVLIVRKMQNSERILLALDMHDMSNMTRQTLFGRWSSSSNEFIGQLVQRDRLVEYVQRYLQDISGIKWMALL